MLISSWKKFNSAKAEHEQAAGGSTRVTCTSLSPEPAREQRTEAARKKTFKGGALQARGPGTGSSEERENAWQRREAVSGATRHGRWHRRAWKQQQGTWLHPWMLPRESQQLLEEQAESKSTMQSEWVGVGFGRERVAVYWVGGLQRNPCVKVTW